MSYSYVVVDVFTEVALKGNPLAVFLDAQGLDDATMQAIARELNLSETVFLFPPEDAGNAARLRIFTPGSEIPFAGHPTIGTAFVLVTHARIAAGATSFVLEENVGPISIRLERSADPFMAWLTTPPITLGATVDREGCARALGLGVGDLLGELPVQIASGGNPFLYVPVRDRARVDAAAFDATAMQAVCGSTDYTGVFIFTPTPAGVYSRMFAPPEFGIIEDPATGSATGPLAVYMAEHALIERKDGLRFVSEQGTHMGRQSFLHVQVHVRENRIRTVEVGGSAVALINARLELSRS